MSDLLVPKERHDAVVFIGVDARDAVEFIKVYAVSRERARQVLEEFINARGLFPADYRLVSEGLEETAGKSAITTRTETGLSSALARFGLKLISNGVLYLNGLDKVYQITLVSESFYSRFEGSEQKAVEPEEVVRKVISMGFNVLVENRRGLELSDLVGGDAVVLREPSADELVNALKGAKQVIVETTDASKYMSFELPVVVKLSPLSPAEFAGMLSSLIGEPVGSERFADYPEERLTERNARLLAGMVRKLTEEGLSLDRALEIALSLNRGLSL
ncbi:hypothetical protein [Thermococcus sp.]|uniref:hypothetical protein n=1 Tax=Thermococcus sp. TaxID=35749 RepID=UPI002633EDB8|nr:hypothetical protein [Thermococcus sp.]